MQGVSPSIRLLSAWSDLRIFSCLNQAATDAARPRCARRRSAQGCRPQARRVASQDRGAQRPRSAALLPASIHRPNPRSGHSGPPRRRRGDGARHGEPSRSSSPQRQTHHGHRQGQRRYRHHQRHLLQPAVACQTALRRTSRRAVRKGRDLSGQPPDVLADRRPNRRPDRQNRPRLPAVGEGQDPKR